MKKIVTALCLALGACDESTEAGKVALSPPDYEVQLRFINLGRESVTLRLEGEAAGVQVPPLGSVAKVGHTTQTLQRATVEARDFLESGEKQAATLPFEFGATDGTPVTFVLRDSMPNRISMNVTVPKQTQGASFGERVGASLLGVEVDGGVDTSGDCLVDHAGTAGAPARVGLYHEPPAVDCDATMTHVFVRPAEVPEDATPYLVQSRDGELQAAWVNKVNAGLHATGGALAQGASLLGGALPGGAVISAAVSSLYVLNGHGAHEPATVTVDGVVVAADVPPGELVAVPARLVAAAARNGLDGTGVRRKSEVQISVGGLQSSTTLGGDAPAACRVPVVCDFLEGEDTLLVVSEHLESSATVLKTKHDTAKNSIGNVRRQIVFGTTSVLASKGCVSVHAGDDTCVMGAASVSSLSGSAGGGAAAASYAATGRLLYPPKALPTDGSTMLLSVVETDAVGRRFTWSSPPGLSPSPGKMPEGFAVVTAGTVLDPTAVDSRALYFVSTGTHPWTVDAALAQ